MKCTVPGLNLKTFSRAINSLAKIGDELYVEPSAQGISFRTVNSSRSAFASFIFKPNFFSHYDAIGASEDVKCKVSMKAFMNILKAVQSSEKSFEKCKLNVDPNEDDLVVMLLLQIGICKTYYLPFIECESLQAVFDKDECNFNLTSQSHIFCDAFTNFHSNHEEVTVSVSPQKTVITNYVDSDHDNSKAIHTELTISAEEFDCYNIDDTCEVTFCLKEVKSLLAFTEPSNIPISLNFATPGKPIIFSIENTSMYEVNFVLATLSTNQLPSQAKDLDFNKTSQRSRHSTTQKDRSLSNSFNVQNLNNSLQSSVLANKSVGHVNGRVETPGRDSMRSRAQMEGDEEENEVPGTPPAKKQRFLFRRCFEPTFNASNISGFNVVYAEDSDEEK